MMTPDLKAPGATPQLHRNQIETVEKQSAVVRVRRGQHATGLGSVARIPRIHTAPGSAPSSETHRPTVANGSWRLGLVTDRDGRVHLGVVIADADECEPKFIELLAPLVTPQLTPSDLARMTVLVHGEQLASLRRIVDKCIDDDRLRSRLLELIERSAAQFGDTTWPG